MAKYRKKPVVIEAEQYIPGITTPFLKEANMIPIDSDTDWECKNCGEKAHYHMIEGWHIVCPGDYIIKGIKGGFYPCKPDIFEMTYEKVKESDEAWNLPAETKDNSIILNELIPRCTPKAAELLKSGLLGAIKVCAVNECIHVRKK
jgi:hypothetical protein